jgi:hypothetical protein
MLSLLWLAFSCDLLSFLALFSKIGLFPPFLLSIMHTEILIISASIVRTDTIFLLLLSQFFEIVDVLKLLVFEVAFLV